MVKKDNKPKTIKKTKETKVEIKPVKNFKGKFKLIKFIIKNCFKI
jgi:hypothetical protein